jgi:20S proteasome alpha/beta subunit
MLPPSCDPYNDIFSPYWYDTDTISPCQSQIAQELSKEEVTNLSIAIGLIGKDGIVLATDSRLTAIYSYSQAVITHRDNFTKLWNIADTMGVAGIGNSPLILNQYIQLFQMQIENQGLKTTRFDYRHLVEYFTECIKDDWTKIIQDASSQLLSIRELRKGIYGSFEFIVAGYIGDIPSMKFITTQKRRPIPVVRNIVRNCYYATKGISFIASYWISKIEELLPSMNIQQLKRLVVFLMCESTYFDTIGGDIQMVSIRKDTGVQTITKDELTQLKNDVMKATDESVELLINKLQE